MGPPRQHLMARAYSLDTKPYGGDGDEGAVLGNLQAYHSTNYDGSPFRVANEFVANEIGHYLQVPVAPGAICADQDGNPYYSSINVNFDRRELATVSADHCWLAMPELCWAIFLFDILIANDDRHIKNVIVDHPLKPSKIVLIDHEYALLGGRLGDEGTHRLNRMSGRLGVTGPTRTGGTPHFLLHVIEDHAARKLWMNRISKIPAWWIDEVCSQTRGLGVSAEISKTLASWLKARRSNIDDLIDSNIEKIPSLSIGGQADE